MPGASYTVYSDTTAPRGWSFTYSTRLAWYPVSSTWSIVGEVYGGAGAASTDPTYKAGLRLEPNQYSVFALTYGAQFNGGTGSGWELGMMLFTPPFFCITGCHDK